MRKEPGVNSNFTCESCLKKVCMVIKEYGTGRWLCYDCHIKKEVSQDTREALLKVNNINV